MDNKNIGPSRPLFVLFGSSIVQLSYYHYGWGATLTGLYARKDKKIQPSLVILYFGGDDSTDPDVPNSPQVPLDEYVENMRKNILHTKGLSENTRLIMLSTSAVNEQQIIDFYGDNLGRTNERCRIYSEAGIKLAQKLNVKFINFWSTLQESPDWLTTVFWDGMHLTKEGSDIVYDKITKVIKEAEWEPTLDWDKMPDEFDEIEPRNMEIQLFKLHQNINKIIGITNFNDFILE